MQSSVLARHNVTVSGRGTQPIVLAHGFGCDQHMWRFVAPAFRDDWRVVLFDHAGAGGARRAYDPARHAALAGYAEDLVAIVTALGLRDVVLVGHSVSATIAMLAARRAPERFAALVLVAPSPCFLDDPPHYQGGFTRAALDGLLAMMQQNYTAWADALAPTVIGVGNAAEGAAARTRELRDSFCAMDPGAALAFARAAFLEDHRATVPDVPVPSLILQCSADALAPAAVGGWLHDHLPRSTLRRLAATGHCPHMTHPAETAAAILEYLTPMQASGASDAVPAQWARVA